MCIRDSRAEMQKYETEESLLQYLKHQNIWEQFARFAENKGLKRRNILMYKSQKLFETNLYGNIIYNKMCIRDSPRSVSKHQTATIQME